jgi:hypothetical protein
MEFAPKTWSSFQAVCPEGRKPVQDFFLIGDVGKNIVRAIVPAFRQKIKIEKD